MHDFGVNNGWRELSINKSTPTPNWYFVTAYQAFTIRAAGRTIDADLVHILDPIFHPLPDCFNRRDQARMVTKKTGVMLWSTRSWRADAAA